MAKICIFGVPRRVPQRGKITDLKIFKNKKNIFRSSADLKIREGGLWIRPWTW